MSDKFEQCAHLNSSSITIDVSNVPTAESIIREAFLDNDTVLKEYGMQKAKYSKITCSLEEFQTAKCEFLFDFVMNIAKEYRISKSKLDKIYVQTIKEWENK